MYQRKANSNALPAVPMATPFADAKLELVETGNGFTLACYHHRIPTFVDGALDRLYGSIYSSLAQLEVEGSTAGIHTYVAYRDSEIVDLWLFRVERNAVRVLNEAIPIRADAVRRFADLVFSTNASVDMIRFNAVYPALAALGLPVQRFHCTDDSVLALPATSDAYLASLGKATRKNLKRYLSRVAETFPTFRYEVHEREAIPEAQVHAIIALNRERMAAKGKACGIDDMQVQRILKLVKRCGLVGIATIDGRICAGAIVYRAGNNYFSFVRAHDPTYDHYRLGLIGAYHLVCACIARGGRELHLMWGREPHKSLLGGEHRTLDHVIVFRSWPRMLLHADLLLKNAASGLARNAKQRLLDKAGENDDVGARLLRRGIAAARMLKRCLRRTQEGRAHAQED